MIEMLFNTALVEILLSDTTAGYPHIPLPRVLACKLGRRSDDPRGWCSLALCALSAVTPARTRAHYAKRHSHLPSRTTHTRTLPPSRCQRARGATQCWGSDHTPHAIAAMVLTIIYPIGIPLSALYVLYSRRSELDLPFEDRSPLIRGPCCIVRGRRRLMRTQTLLVVCTRSSRRVVSMRSVQSFYDPH